MDTGYCHRSHNPAAILRGLVVVPLCYRCSDFQGLVPVLQGPASVFDFADVLEHVAGALANAPSLSSTSPPHSSTSTPSTSTFSAFRLSNGSHRRLRTPFKLLPPSLSCHWHHPSFPYISVMFVRIGQSPHGMGVPVSKNY